MTVSRRKSLFAGFEEVWDAKNSLGEVRSKHSKIRQLDSSSNDNRLETTQVSKIVTSKGASKVEYWDMEGKE